MSGVPTLAPSPSAAGRPAAGVPRRTLVLIAIAAIVAALLTMAIVYRNFWEIPDPDHSSHWVHVPVLLFWIFVGEYAWARRPDNPLGRWMIAVGFVGFEYVGVLGPFPITWTISWAFGSLQLLLIAYVYLGFPDGRLHDRVDRWLVAILAVYVIGWTLVQMQVDPIPMNLLFWVTDPDIQATVWRISDWLGPTMTLAAAWRVLAHWRRARAAERRIMTPILLAAIPFLVVLVLQRTDVVFGQSVVSDVAWSWGGALIPQFALPLGFLAGIMRTKLARSSVAEVVRELDAGVEPGRLGAVLGRALGDPTLQLAYRLPDGGYVDGQGRAVALPGAGTGRRVTPLGRGGDDSAVMVHDPGVDADPELVASVAASARLALENERLQAEIRAQLEEVRASRTRIVEAGLDARRKVERDLHDGAQQRLLALQVRLQLARSAAEGDARLEPMLSGAGRDLEAAIGELRELARGLHPTVLTELGLGPAVENLADRAPVPVDVSVTGERCSGACEAAAYFVVSEALTNIARHARATHAGIRIRRSGDDLHVEITDDGVGGASLAAGSGLRGLADRVAAVGGTLSVESPPGGGTHLLASIPCA